MVTRTLTPYYRLKQDDPSYPQPNFDAQHPDGSGSNNLHVNVRTDEHIQLAREIAAASCVLLKNANSTGSTGSGSGKALPLSNTFTGSVAIVGQDAAMPTDCGNLDECNNGVMVVG
jgi:beta-glucosidase